MPSCHRFLSVGTFNKEAFINLGMRFSMGDIRPPHNQNAQDLSRWVVCLLVTQQNEQLQKSGEISFQLKIYNKATCSAPLFTSWHETPTNIVKTPIFSLRIVFLVGILFVDVSKFSKKNAVVCNV